MNQDINNQIGSRLKDMRLQKNMTQAELAERADLSVNMISSIETAGRKISVETLMKLAGGLEVEPEYFLTTYNRRNKYSYLAEKEMRIEENRMFYQSIIDQLIEHENRLVDDFNKN